MENVYIFDLDNTLYSFPPGKKYFDYSFLKDDPELSDEERFELYYDEREKRRERKTGMSYEQLLKKSGVKPPSAKK